MERSREGHIHVLKTYQISFGKRRTRIKYFYLLRYNAV
jgi:hypothetical protein